MRRGKKGKKKKKVTHVILGFSDQEKFYMFLKMVVDALKNPQEITKLRLVPHCKKETSRSYNGLSQHYRSDYYTL